MIKIIGSEVTLGTANDVSNSTAVRIYNNTAADVLITRANTGGTIGTLTLKANTELIFVKAADDTLAANDDVLATPVAYHY